MVEMTKEKITEMANVMLESVDHEWIQFRERNDTTWYSARPETITWNWEERVYRIKAKDAMELAFQQAQDAQQFCGGVCVDKDSFELGWKAAKANSQ